MIWTAETWMRQRGTWGTTPAILRRDLGLRIGTACMALRRLHDAGRAIRIAPKTFIHVDCLPEVSPMSTLILTDADGHERHRADFPNRLRADIALRIVERDIRDGRPAVRIVGHHQNDPIYKVTGVARAMVQPTPLPVLPADDEPTAFDARSRAAGDQ